jgi:hypothetical protein
VFIPTYVNFVAAYKDPWFVNDEDALNAMQEVWDVVFLNRSSSEDIPHVIELNMAVFSIVRSLTVQGISN